MKSARKKQAVTPVEMRHYLEVERAKSLLAGIKIPPRPTVLLDVLNEQQRPDVDLERFDQIIGSDVALASGTLKVVNSPFFGLRQRVGSIPHAIRLLGTANVVNIAIGLTLQEAFQDQQGPFIKRFWGESNKLAATCTLIARHLPTVPIDEAYAVGLLADCGVPLLASRFPDYAVIYEAAQQQQQLTVSGYEEKHLGSNHTAAGVLLAEDWKLPQSFVSCILRHHDTTNYFVEEDLADEAPLLATLQLANAIVRKLRGLPPSAEWVILADAVLAYLNITDEHLAAIEEEATAHE